jgi:hypothetical protein
MLAWTATIAASASGYVEVLLRCHFLVLTLSLRLQQDMKSKGLVLKEEPHTLRVPRSQRGGEVIEPLVSEQWFVKMETLAAPGESHGSLLAYALVCDVARVRQLWTHWSGMT